MPLLSLALQVAEGQKSISIARDQQVRASAHASGPEDLKRVYLETDSCPCSLQPPDRELCALSWEPQQSSASTPEKLFCTYLPTHPCATSSTVLSRKILFYSIHTDYVATLVFCVYSTSYLKSRTRYGVVFCTSHHFSDCRACCFYSLGEVL